MGGGHSTFVSPFLAVFSLRMTGWSTLSGRNDELSENDGKVSEGWERKEEHVE